MSETAKKQSLVHIGSTVRDELEAIGATYEPPMCWQDLARQVLKSFTNAVQHDAALGRVQQRIMWDLSPVNDDAK